MQLIPDVSGNYHLLFFKSNTPVSVYIFNHELQSAGKKELPVKFKDTCDIRILPFKNFYLVYLHKPGSTKHELWQVNAEGTATSLTGAFQKFIEATFQINTSTLQLVNQDDELVVITHTYYDEPKALASTITRVNKSFKTISSKTVSYSYNPETDLLYQAMLIGDNLFILESSEHAKSFSLQLIKADLTTGKLFRKTFDSDQDFSRDAAFRYNNLDSSILIFSNVGSQVFASKLDFYLNEKGTPALVKPRFNSNAAYNFILMGGETQQWLAMNLPYNRQRRPSDSYSYGPTTTSRQSNQYRNLDFGGSFPNNYLGESSSVFDSNNPYSFNTSNKNMAAPVNLGHPICFSVTNNDFKLIKDTVISNKKGPKTLSSNEFANLKVGNKSYLILKQEFSHGEKGLLQVSVDRNNQISTKDISVIDKFQYLLKDARAMQNELVMPFVQKYEMGLIKLSFTDDEDSMKSTKQ